MLQAGGHAHVAEGLGGNGAQEMGVCGRAEGGGVDIRSPDTSSPWGRVSSYPPPPEPSLGAALPPIPRGRRLGSPIPLQAWAGRPDPVQGVDSLSPHLSRLLPQGRAWPSSLERTHIPGLSPKPLAGLLLLWTSGRSLPGPPAQSYGGGGPSSLRQPLYQAPRGQPPSLRGEAPAPFVPQEAFQRCFW